MTSFVVLRHLQRHVIYDVTSFVTPKLFGRLCKSPGQWAGWIFQNSSEVSKSQFQQSEHVWLLLEILMSDISETSFGINSHSDISHDAAPQGSSPALHHVLMTQSVTAALLGSDCKQRLNSNDHYPLKDVTSAPVLHSVCLLACLFISLFVCLLTG